MRRAATRISTALLATAVLLPVPASAVTGSGASGGKHRSVPQQRAAAGTAELTVDKEALDVPSPLTPGKTFSYRITVSCSSLTTACEHVVLDDTVPAGLEVTAWPNSAPPTRIVEHDDATKHLRVTYAEDIGGGKTGLPAGVSRSVEIGVRLPVDTSYPDGQTVSNVAHATADNASPAQDGADVRVTVPRAIRPVGTKSWAPASAVAGSAAASTVTLGVRNGSAGAQGVDTLRIDDMTGDTWRAFDLSGAPRLAAFPPGADRARLLVCTKPPATPCTDAELQSGAAVSAAGTLPLPSGVIPGQVTGVRVVFSSSAGTLLPPSASSGSVELGLRLRDTVRGDGTPLRPTTRQRIDNCALPGAQDAGGSTDGATACAPFDILPNQATLGLRKQFFSDAAGSWKPNGTALLGRHAPVSAVVTAENTSPFALRKLSITEPSATSVSRFSAMDASTLRPVFPAGATGAGLAVSCRDGSTLPPVTLTPAASGKDRALGCPAGVAAKQVELTYTGSIPVGATASLGVHGTLNGTETAADVTGGLLNCADSAASNPTDGSGSAAATACANLPLQQPTEAVGGVKSASQREMAKGQPVDFALTMSNTGNTELGGIRITDPVDPTATPTMFQQVRLLGFGVVSSTPKGLNPGLEVYDPGKGGWVAYDPADDALLARATGVRAILDGTVPVGAKINLSLSVQLRDDAADSGAFTNCARIEASGAVPHRDACAPQTLIAPQRAGASLGKVIAPGTVARTLPGVPPQSAQVRLALANTGNQGLRQLIATDADQDFFDAMDLRSVDKVNFPPGADQVRVDVCTDACAAGRWILGKDAATPALPAGVAPGEVRGIRFVFSARAGGYALLPGANLPSSGACPAASACFSVSPRATLRSRPDQAIPASSENTAAGGYESRLQPPGQLAPIPTAAATLTVDEGSAQLRLDKTPDSKVGPGEPAPFTLTVQNSGTGVVPELVVADPVPAGLQFDESYRGPGDLPFRLSFEVPAGTPSPAADEVVFEPQRAADGSISALRWRFPAWRMLPGSTVRISYQAKPAGGTAAGATLRNTAGASSAARPDLSCALTGPRAGQAVDDPQFGKGRYCTGWAQVTTVGGAAFDAFKWVTGTPELGWYDSVSKERVAVGDARCPQLLVAGRAYTRYPCVALGLAGQPHEYVIRLTNTGTQPATRAQLLDVLPHQGDTGVLLGREQRGTEWTRPATLSGPPALLSEPGTLSVRYSEDPAPCSAKVPTPNRVCRTVDWGAGFEPTALGLEMELDFPTPLKPGESALISLPLTSPRDPAAADAVTADGIAVAWNSFAHRETVLSGGSGGSGGGTVTLPVTEPPKSGIGLLFGALRVEKLVENPPPGGVTPGPYTLAYSCTVAGAVIRTGTGEVTPEQPWQLDGIPAGASCAVWETDAAGAVSSSPDRQHAATVEIGPALDGKGPALVRITNSYPPYPVLITKKVTGAAAALVGQGPFAIEVDCRLDGVRQPGFPRTLTFHGAGTQVISNLPIGARCAAVETDRAGASSSTVAAVHSSDPQVAVVNSVPGEIAELVVGNDFPAGALRLTTTLSGPGAPKAEGPFRYAVNCSFGARADVVKRQVVLRRGDLSALLSGLPAGARCTVRVTAAGGADRTTLATGPFTVPANGTALVPIDHHFPAPGTGGQGSGGGHPHPSPSPTAVDNGSGGGSNGGGSGDGGSAGGLARTGGGGWQPFVLGGLTLIGVGLALRNARRRRSS